ncbi:isochorismatase family protein [Massilia sp. S19_KUP03_FR1]|uniref:isochorismatase family protein n=1 Tax=Massilia sp. S19_KUP03_FR1 TaxID=3025503 RepID=UPI002FCDAA4B
MTAAIHPFKIDIAHTALVVIDLQHGIVAGDHAPYSSDQVVGNTVLLAQSMRNHGGTVIFVHVQLDELLQMGGDAPISGRGAPPPPHASVLVPEVGVEATDIVVKKRSWGAFYGTDLELQLRRNNVKNIILCGIATNYGVESTAREAFDRGFHLYFAEDAMTSGAAELHHFSTRKIFPAMGKVRSTVQLIEAMPPEL